MKIFAHLTTARALAFFGVAASLGCADDTAKLDGIPAALAGATPSRGEGMLIVMPLTPLTPSNDDVRLRIDGQYVIAEAGDGQWVHERVGARMVGVTIPAGSHTVELVDDQGAVVGNYGPFLLHENLPGETQGWTKLMAWAGASSISWKLADPSTQDDDPATAQFTIVNTLEEPVVVERCRLRDTAQTCATLATLDAHAELTRTEVVNTDSDAHDSLQLRPVAASAPTSYETSLQSGESCPVAVVVVTGRRQVIDPSTGLLAGVTGFARGSCRY